MTRIIIVRHGQSLANAARRFAGHSDFDLSELGREQAKRVALYLEKNEKPDVIYSSDLLRAYHTACPTAEALGLSVIKDEGLREIYAGDWEALEISEISERFSEDFAIWRGDYANSRPTGGESTVEVYERVVPHILELAKKHDGETVLITTHATVTRAFITYAKGLSAADTGLLQGFPKNASINVFTYENGRVTEEYTDMTDHLEGLEKQPDPHA